MGIETKKWAVLYLLPLASAYALTCPAGATLESDEVNFIEALDQSTGANKGVATAGSLSVKGVTDHVGTAVINNSGAAHGANKAGVRFKLDSKSSLGNNSGTKEAPSVALTNYQVVTYSFSNGVTFSDPVVLKDLDSSKSEKYIDAATLLYEDSAGNIVAPAASVVGSKLIDFSVSVSSQPSALNLPSSMKGYAPSAYKGVSNSNDKYWVTWDLSGVTIKKLIVLYWNNQTGTTASGAQGISLSSPLKFDMCTGGGSTGGGGTNPRPTPDPKISLIKYIESVSDTNHNTITDAGDVIRYGFKVKNTGNVELKNVTISDALATVSGGSLSTLAVGAEDVSTFSAEYTITDADVAAGGVENSATVHAKDTNGNDVSDISDTGTDPQVQTVNNPETIETPSPLGVNANDASDPTEDPTTLKIDIVTAHIGDLFWIDENGNGLKDASEGVVAGATIELFDDNGNAISDVNGNHSVVTDANGMYGFDVIGGRTYTLKFNLPDEYIAKNYEFTSGTVDADGALIMKVTPTAGNHVLTLDAPIGCGCDNAPIQANDGDSLSLMGMLMMLITLLGMGAWMMKEEKYRGEA